MRAGLLKEVFLLSEDHKRCLPIVIKVDQSWNSEEAILNEVRKQIEKLGFSDLFGYIKKVEYRIVLVLDQFENIFKRVNLEDVVKCIVEICLEYQWQLIIGIRDDYFYSTKIFFEHVGKTNNINLFGQEREILLEGLTQTDVQQYLDKFPQEIIRSNTEAILIASINDMRESFSEKIFDPARLQIILYCLFNNKVLQPEFDKNLHTAKETIKNSDRIYLEIIFANFPKQKGIMKEILLRYGVEKEVGRNAFKRTFCENLVLQNLEKKHDIIEIESSLDNLVHTRIIRPLSLTTKKGTLQFDLTHDRIAENLYSNYKEQFNAYQTIEKIEKKLEEHNRQVSDLPVIKEIKNWYHCLIGIQDFKEHTPQVILYISFLAYIIKESSKKFKDLEIPDSHLTHRTFPINAIETPKTLINSLFFFEDYLTNDILNQYVKRFAVLSQRLEIKEKQFFLLNFIKNLSHYKGQITKELFDLAYFTHEISETIDSIQTIARGIGNAITTSIRIKQSFNLFNNHLAELFVLDLLPHQELDIEILPILKNALHNSIFTWKVCQVIANYTKKARNQNPLFLDSLMNNFKDKLKEIYEKHQEDWYLIPESPNNNKLKTCFFLVEALTQLHLKVPRCLDFALNHKDARIREVFGRLFLQTASEKELVELLDKLDEHNSFIHPKRWGDGKEPYRKRHSIIEILDQVNDVQLEINHLVKEAYRKKLKDKIISRFEILKTKFEENEECLKWRKPADREVRDPDVFDEDLSATLILLLASVSSWEDLDIFLKTLEEPYCYIGAYDISEEGVKALMHLAKSQGNKISINEKQRIIKKMQLCFQHPHNGVSGRAALLFKWLGNENDLDLLKDLETNTFKYVRQNALRARRSILDKFDNWGQEKEVLDSDTGSYDSTINR